jgi:hypothetical protein
LVYACLLVAAVTLVRAIAWVMYALDPALPPLLATPKEWVDLIGTKPD